MPNNPPKNRWLIGEENVLTSPFKLRNMSNPNDGKWPQPDTYGGTYWQSTTGCTPSVYNDYCGVHNNSGVFNFWFYLISEGGCGNNDIGNTYLVPAIGINDAAKLAYKTEQLLSSGSNYAQARTMSIQAAQLLFGAGSIQERAVTRAWYAVGVGINDASNNNLYTITGTNSLCSSTPQIYTVNNLPVGATVVWSRTPSNTTTLTQSSSNVATLTKNANANGVTTLTATITTACGTFTSSMYVFLGIGTNTITGPEQACARFPTSYTVDVLPGELVQDITSISWQLKNNITNQNIPLTASNSYIDGEYPNITIIGNNSSIPKNVQLSLTCTIQSACGTTVLSKNFVMMPWTTCPFGLTSTTNTTFSQNLKVYPNPTETNKSITLELSALDKTAKANFENTTIQLVDANDNIILQKQGNKVEKETLEIPSLSNGTYYVRIINQYGTKAEQIIIKN